MKQFSKYILFLFPIGKISVEKINLPTSGQMMMSKAVSCLELLVNSVQDRSIAVGTLELLASYSKQFLVLGEIIQKSHETSSDIYQRIPINDAFDQCLEELAAFLKEKEILKRFLDFCEHFKTGWCKLLVQVVRLSCSIGIIRFALFSLSLRHKQIVYQIVVTPLA